MESSRQIEDIAADWLTRRDGQEWTEADEAQLRAWLGASIANRVAFVRLEAAWDHALRLQALGAGRKPGAVPPPGEWRVSPFFEQRQPVKTTNLMGSGGVSVGADEEDSMDCGTGAQMKSSAPPVASQTEISRPSPSRYLAIAASIVLLVGISAYMITVLRAERYVTPVGAVSTFPLRDGSNVTLNTSSRIRVDLTNEVRHVELEQGEVFFEIAKDALRPFIVEAGTRRVVVVGTKFSVRRDGEDVQVVVTEGAVRLLSSSAAAKVERGEGALLTAGSIAHTASREVMVRSHAEPVAEQLVSWRSGFLSFDVTPLADAIAEFNRYTPYRISIRDPKLAALHVSGKFRATNADAFIRVLKEGFGIQAYQAGDQIVLSMRQDGPYPE